MKFSSAISAVVLILPLLAEAVPQQGKKSGAKKAKGNKTSSAVASATSSAAAAATSIAATGQAQTGKVGKGAQSSLQLDPSQVMAGLGQDGQAVPEAGQVPSLTSTNNFINFCATLPKLPLTNGQQVVTGSCNPTPMGVILAKAQMPSSKFTNPKNLDVVKSNTPFTVTMAINNLVAGNFVNAQQNYFAAPAFTDDKGILKGHSHVVIEAISSFQDTKPTDPTKFAFFKGLNNPATNGVLSANVTNGLPAGFYRLASINTAANHQPALVAIAQHGSLDDAVYFEVSDSGKSTVAAGGNNGQKATATATTGNQSQKAAPTSGNGGQKATAGKKSSGGKKNKKNKSKKGRGRGRGRQ